MWAVNSPPSARKPITSTAPAVALRTVGSSQPPHRGLSRAVIIRFPDPSFGSSSLSRLPTRHGSCSARCELTTAGARSVSGCPLFQGLRNHPFAAALGLLAVQADLDDVRPEQQGERPVDHDAQTPAP